MQSTIPANIPHSNLLNLQIVPTANQSTSKKNNLPFAKEQEPEKAEEKPLPKKANLQEKADGIQAYCRLRPIKGPSDLFCVNQIDDRILVINEGILKKMDVPQNLKKLSTYKFSKVFGDACSQQDVFAKTTQPLCEDFLLKNKSGLVFTYGMTNAGKTFTVIGEPNNPGILPQALEYLMAAAERQKNESSNKAPLNLFCNFVEIYNEDVFDLLADDPAGKDRNYKKKLSIKENYNGVFFLPEVRNEKLDNVDKFNSVLAKGIGKKVHASTNLNQNSSRSHTVFKIMRYERADMSRRNVNEAVTSLTIVDLAGSERQKRTDAKGKNLKEACQINQSLSTLGKCFDAMKHNTQSSDKKPVPFRESKLTKIFSEYFQGRQNVIMITNINPRREDFEESVRALEYSCVAKAVRPIKSVIPKVSGMSDVKNQLKRQSLNNEKSNPYGYKAPASPRNTNINELLFGKKFGTEAKSEGKLNISAEKQENESADEKESTFNLNLNEFDSEKEAANINNICEVSNRPNSNGSKGSKGSKASDIAFKLFQEIKNLRMELKKNKGDSRSKSNSPRADYIRSKLLSNAQETLNLTPPFIDANSEAENKPQFQPADSTINNALVPYNLPVQMNPFVQMQNFPAFPVYPYQFSPFMMPICNGSEVNPFAQGNAYVKKQEKKVTNIDKVLQKTIKNIPKGTNVNVIFVDSNKYADSSDDDSDDDAPRKRRKKKKNKKAAKKNRK